MIINVYEQSITTFYHYPLSLLFTKCVCVWEKEREREKEKVIWSHFISFFAIFVCSSVEGIACCFTFLGLSQTHRNFSSLLFLYLIFWLHSSLICFSLQVDTSLLTRLKYICVTVLCISYFLLWPLSSRVRKEETKTSITF